MENNFFGRNIATTKADHQLSETFYFTKISYFLLIYESFSILSDFFCQKLSFPSKTAVRSRNKK